MNQPSTWPTDGRPPTADDYNALVHFTRQRVPPATAVYVTVDDTILLSALTPSGNQTVRLSLRFQAPNGEIIPQFFILNSVANGQTPTRLTITGHEGYLLSATIDTSLLHKGQAFCTLELKRGGGTADQTLGHLLISGYVTASAPLGFPQTPCQTSVEGRGFMQALVVSNPAAGTDWVTQLGAGENWILRSVVATLVTSAAVANRVPVLVIDDGIGDIVAQVPPIANQAASLTVVYSWFSGAVLNNFGGIQNLPLPNEYRLANVYRVRSLTTAIQAADQWSSIVLLVERFVEP